MSIYFICYNFLSHDIDYHIYLMLLLLILLLNNLKQNISNTFNIFNISFITIFYYLSLFLIIFI